MWVFRNFLSVLIVICWHNILMFLSTVSVGCDSGFGNATAKRLDAMGFEVFATVLNMDGEGAKHLHRVCSSRLTLLQVDITQPQQVQQALLDTKAKLGMRGEDLLLSYARSMHTQSHSNMLEHNEPKIPLYECLYILKTASNFWLP